jgi:hypothetical protein
MRLGVQVSLEASKITFLLAVIQVSVHLNDRLRDEFVDSLLPPNNDLLCPQCAAGSAMGATLHPDRGWARAMPGASL